VAHGGHLATFEIVTARIPGPWRPGLGDSLISSGGAAAESRDISRRRLRRNGAESDLNRSDREFPVVRLLSSCYLPDPSLLSANNLPVIFPLWARRRTAPYFDNHLKGHIFLAAN
jgi:hypothetical protein